MSQIHPDRLWKLEALRGSAALYIVLHHISSNYLQLKHTIWGFPFRFGSEAVLIFFLLSGFVICYSCSGLTGPGSYRIYFIKRARRIYPIFVTALLLAFVVEAATLRAIPSVNFGQLAGNLLMLQDRTETPGALILPLWDNWPLWSLSYEWWFYMMFYPINRWVPVAKQKYLVLALCLFGMSVNLLRPNAPCWFLVYFLLWWAGVELAREYVGTGTVTFRKQRITIALLSVPMLGYALLAFKRIALDGQHVSFISYPVAQFRFFLMALALIAVMFVWKQARFIGFKQTLGLFRPVAGISYALYVFHFPFICKLRLLPGSEWYYLDLVLRVFLVFAIAWLAERPLQKMINRFTDRLLLRPAPAFRRTSDARPSPDELVPT